MGIGDQDSLFTMGAQLFEKLLHEGALSDQVVDLFFQLANIQR